MWRVYCLVRKISIILCVAKAFGRNRRKKAERRKCNETERFANKEKSFIFFLISRPRLRVNTFLLASPTSTSIPHGTHTQTSSPFKMVAQRRNRKRKEIWYHHFCEIVFFFFPFCSFSYEPNQHKLVHLETLIKNNEVRKCTENVHFECFHSILATFPCMLRTANDWNVCICVSHKMCERCWHCPKKRTIF